MFFTRIGGQGVHQSHVLGWEGEMEGEGKKKSIEHTVMPSVALWNVGFQ
jgi:hypothetical protein